MASILAPAPIILELSGARGRNGEKGDPGGNAMAIGLFVDAAALSIPDGTDLVQTSGYGIVGKGAARYAYDEAVDDDFVAAHPRASFVAENDRGFRLAEPVIDAMMTGADGTGIADDTDALKALFEYCTLYGLEWRIGDGSYTFNPSAPVDIRTSGICRGEIVAPRSNANATLRLSRDGAGTVVDVSDWTLERGVSAIGAANAASKIVDITSTEVLIERDGQPSYYKQELVKVLLDGSLSRALVHTYDADDVTATAHELSRPITVQGLRMHLTGTGNGTALGSVRIERDNVHFIDLKMSVENGTEVNGVDQGVSVYKCFAPTFTNPVISGFQRAGLGYGIIFSNTLKYTVNNGYITECRHAISGRHNVDGSINYGTYDLNIDEHWGDNLVITGVTCNTAPGNAGFFYAGNDIRLVDCTVNGGRTYLLERSDTPYLGGIVDIIRPKWFTYAEQYGIYGLFVTQGSFNGPFATPPRDPDVINIDSPTMYFTNPPGGQTVYLVSTDGDRTAPYVPIGKLNLTGVADFGGRDFHTGVLLFKNSAVQLTRGTQVNINGRYEFGAGNIAFVIGQDSDTVRPHTLTINGAQGNLRWSAKAVSRIVARDCAIGTIDVDGSAADFDAASRYYFNGGTISASVDGQLRNAIFASVNFTDELAAFPASVSGGVWTSFVSLSGSYSDVAQPGMPDDLLANIVAPFNGQI